MQQSGSGPTSIDTLAELFRTATKNNNASVIAMSEQAAFQIAFAEAAMAEATALTAFAEAAGLTK